MTAKRIVEEYQTPEEIRRKRKKLFDKMKHPLTTDQKQVYIGLVIVAVWLMWMIFAWIRRFGL